MGETAEVGSESLRERMMELFGTGKEAVRYLNDTGLQGQAAFLGELRALCAALSDAIQRISNEISLQNKLREIGLNACDSMDRLLESLEAGDLRRAEMKFACEFVPLFLFWERYSAVFLIHGRDEESIRQWREAEREDCRRICGEPKEDGDRDCPYDFTVVVLFYGHREMTKSCLDSIAAYTKGHSYELVTVDNGSDEKTAAWCESLPHPKKIRYRYNMGSSVGGSLIFSMARLYAKGKYLLYVSNDVIVTPRYDDILYQCMESDPRIAMAAPVCNSASNLQAIPVPYAKNNLAEMQAFAEQYNHSDPKKWVDRARLFPILGCYRMQALSGMYLAYDPLFCYDMFTDDDQCCTLRRMGWRQVLCRDVFVHHFGSATIGDDQYRVMDAGRAQFYEKYGVDAWNSLGMEFYGFVERLTFPAEDSCRILVINPLFGESALALYSRIRSCGCSDIMLDALTEDPRYLDDMVLFQKHGRIEDARELLGNRQYDIAMIGTSLERCKDLSLALHVAASRLKGGGALLTVHENLMNYRTLSALLMGGGLENDLFLRDPQENPVKGCLSQETLDKLAEGEKLSMVRPVFAANEQWREPVMKVFQALGIQPQKETVERLLASSQYTIWKRKDL